MSYNTKRQQVGRRPLHIIKLTLDSGALYFCEPWSELPAEFNSTTLHPTLQPGSLRVTPARISYEKIGEVGKIQFTLRDVPESAGTFWGKKLAADPYFLRRECLLYVGYWDNDGTLDANDFEARAYLIEVIDGPDSRGNVTITAKSPLREVLDKSNLAPRADETTLDGAHTDSVTTIDVLPAGTIASWATSGKIIINDEIISYTGITSDQLTGCTRGENNTTAAAHSDGDAIQRCLEYTNESLDSVIDDLLSNYTNLASTYKDTSQWASQVTTWLNADRLDRVITKPTPVHELIAEACNQSLALFYFHERDQKLYIKAIAPTIGALPEIDETDDILRDSQSIKRDFKEQYTRVIVHYDKRNPTEDDKPENYARAVLRVDSARESASAWGHIRTKTINATWIGTSGQATAIKLAARTLSRFGDGITTYTFSTDSGNDNDLWIGDSFVLNTDLMQDATGAQSGKNMLILEASEENGSQRDYVATIDTFSGGADSSRYGLIAPNSQAVYTSASAAEQAKYGFICNNSNQMSNGDDPYLII